MQNATWTWNHLSPRCPRLSLYRDLLNWFNLPQPSIFISESGLTLLSPLKKEDTIGYGLSLSGSSQIILSTLDEKEDHWLQYTSRSTYLLTSQLLMHHVVNEHGRAIYNQWVTNLEKGFKRCWFGAIWARIKLHSTWISAGRGTSCCLNSESMLQLGRRTLSMCRERPPASLQL